jgi:hypothetical protein
LLYSGAYINFALGDFNRSLDLINTILDRIGNDSRLDIQKATRILNLIVHFELGHNELLPYVIRSTYRYLRKREQLYPAERQLLRLLRRLPSINTARDLIKLFGDTREQLDTRIEGDDDTDSMGYFDVRAWLDAKIQQQSFAEVVARTHRSRMHRMQRSDQRSGPRSAHRHSSIS